jgi:DNA excision repair protein ERCC-5
MNRQGNLSSFFDVAPGSGSYAPRKRQAYGSKRLQQVVTDFRTQQAQLKGGSTSTAVPDKFTPEDDHEPAIKKRKTGVTRKSQAKINTRVTRRKGSQSVTSQRGKNRGSRAQASSSSLRAGQEPESDSGDEYVGNENNDGPSATETLKPRLRPRARPVTKGTRKFDRYDILAADSESS